MPFLWPRSGPRNESGVTGDIGRPAGHLPPARPAGRDEADRLPAAGGERERQRVALLHHPLFDRYRVARGGAIVRAWSVTVDFGGVAAPGIEEVERHGQRACRLVGDAAQIPVVARAV